MAGANDPTFQTNELAGRFELTSGHRLLSYATFVEFDQLVTVSLVFTPPEHRNQGYAADLMEAILLSLRANGQTIRALCPYATTYIERHPEYKDLLA